MKSIFTVSPKNQVIETLGDITKNQDTKDLTIERLRQRIAYLEHLVTIYTTRSKERFDQDLASHTRRATMCKDHLLAEFLQHYNADWFFSENETRFKEAVAESVYKIVKNRNSKMYNYEIESVLNRTPYGKQLLASMLDYDDEV